MHVCMHIELSYVVCLLRMDWLTVHRLLYIQSITHKKKSYCEKTTNSSRKLVPSLKSWGNKISSFSIISPVYEFEEKECLLLQDFRDDTNILCTHYSKQAGFPNDAIFAVWIP